MACRKLYYTTNSNFNRTEGEVGSLYFRGLIHFFVFITLTSVCFSASEKPGYEILAHRGLHQTFSPVGVTNSTCTAARIDEPTHDYVENTIISIQAAIDLGADIVEFDIQPTVDGEFVVFHDWELSCRTNGEGVVREQRYDYLKTLDIGYGYTSDNGKSYPFRGKFVGAMPTLSRSKAKSCVKAYILFGWSGFVPESCHGSLVPVPENYQWLIWGWPETFEKRLIRVNSRSILMGRHEEGRSNSGIDSLESLDPVSEDYKGIVFTNRIDLTGKNSARK